MNLKARITKLEQGTGEGQERVMVVTDDQRLAEALAALDAGCSLYALVDNADFAGQLREAGATVRHLGNALLSAL